MAVNSMQITDVYQILNSLHQQATGRASIAPTNTGEFVSMATTTLAVGTDQIYNTLMQTIGRTIFSTRPYNRKFSGLMADNMRFGGIMRKISMADKAVEAEGAYNTHANLIDGQSVDHYIIKKPDLLEMRFYASDVFQDYVTIFERQLKNAFESPEQLGSLITLITSEMSNKREQYLENLARGALSNFIGAKNSQDAASVIHLLTEYNALTGLNLTAQDIYKEENIGGFFRWVRARINTIAREFTERSGKYQYTVQGKPVNRHTPYDRQKMYITAQALDVIDTMVNTTTYHDEPLAYADVEAINYWQSINTPTQVQVTPSIVNAAGAVSIGELQTVSNIFGLIFDEDAIATNIMNDYIVNTPLNAKGLYYNTWYTTETRYTNDLTEKGALLLLD